LTGVNAAPAPDSSQEETVRRERFGDGVTIDIYSHVVSGLQEVAAQRFEETLDGEALKLLVNPHMSEADVGKMSAKDE